MSMGSRLDAMLAKFKKRAITSSKSNQHYDDMGDGRYDYLGISGRIPIHLEMSLWFAERGDNFNAGMHARAARQHFWQRQESK